MKNFYLYSAIATIIFLNNNWATLGPKNRGWRELCFRIGIIDKLYPKHYATLKKIDRKFLGLGERPVPKLILVQVRIYYITCVLSVLPITSIMVRLIFGEMVSILYFACTIFSYVVVDIIFVFYSFIIEIYLSNSYKKQCKEKEVTSEQPYKTKITKEQILTGVLFIVVLLGILLFGGIIVWLIP